jgi:LacI family transcriptional regulator
MARPTVIDIAREAGVSLATVDRVLNARPGVRAKTVGAVNDAIARLGYVRDIAAANLARQRSYRIAVVLPDTDSQFVQTLAAAFDRAGSLAATDRTAVDVLRFPAEDMHALSWLLRDLAAQGIAGVALMAPETPIVRDAVRLLQAEGIAVAALISDLPNTGRDHFVGIDNHAAGRTAGLLMGRFLCPGAGRIVVLAQSMLSRDSIERRRGFDEVMQRDFPHVEVLPTLETHGSAATLRHVVTEAFANTPDIRGVYVLGSGLRALADALPRQPDRVTVIGHELTPYSRAALLSGAIDAVIAQNAGHLARSALRVLRATIDRQPIDDSQERIRIEIILRENLPHSEEDSGFEVRTSN